MLHEAQGLRKRLGMLPCRDRVKEQPTGFAWIQGFHGIFPRFHKRFSSPSWVPISDKSKNSSVDPVQKIIGGGGGRAGAFGTQTSHPNSFSPEETLQVLVLKSTQEGTKTSFLFLLN